MPAAIVIGGGLAGISAAWELSRRDWDVELYEASHRLGGKAGSELSAKSGYYSDHGYHLFPAWYHNVRQLMAETGIDYDVELIPGERFISRLRTRNEVTHMPEGPLIDRWLKTTAFVWAIAELVVADDSELKKKSLAGFLNDVFEKEYGSPGLYEAARERHGSLTLKALSNSPEDISALTCARMWRRWMSPWRNIGKPSWSALRGSLQEHLIDPLESALGEQDVTIHKRSVVSGLLIHEEDGKKRLVSMRCGDKQRDDLENYTVIIAVPAEKLASLFEHPDNSGIPGWAHRISHDTKVGQMSAIDYQTSPLVTKTPADHFGFGEGDLTGFDITRHWNRRELPPSAVRGNAATGTVLQVIATNTNKLESEEALELAVKPDVLALMGRSEDQVEAAEIHLNDDAELYLNTVENSQQRPDQDTPARDGFEDVFLAGDYCETSIDVASMEAAVASGRLAAERALGIQLSHVEVDTSWVETLMTVLRRSPILGLIAGISRIKSALVRG